MTDRRKDSAEERLRRENAKLRAEIAALHQSEENFHRVFEQAAISISVTGLDGQWISINPKLCEATGYTKEELMARTFRDITLEDTGDRDWPALNDLRTGAIAEYKTERRYIRKDGSTFWGNLSVSLVRDAQGAPAYFIAFMEDIDRRKHAEELVRGQAEALARTLSALTAEPDLDRHLGQVLRTLTEQFGATRAEMWLNDTEQGVIRPHLIVQGGEVHPASEMASHRSVMDGVPLEAIQRLPPYHALYVEHLPYVLQGVQQDANLGGFWTEAHRGLGTLLLIPLIFAGKYLGTLILSHHDDRLYQTEDLELAQMLAQQVVLASELTRLARDARLEAQQAAVFGERNRLAGEIHDSLAQNLTGIIVHLNAALDEDTHDPAERREHAAQAHLLATEGLAEARRSVQALQPGPLEGRTLGEALRRLCDQMTLYMSLQIIFSLSGLPLALPKGVEGGLLRIAQEALTNVYKHAQAQEARLELTYRVGVVELRVRDDGQGFDVDGQTPGFGLSGIRERAQDIGADLTVTSHLGRGTEVIVTVKPAPPV